jgi:chorismate-pyruvate lyase
MASPKNEKSQPKTISLEVPIDSALSSKIENISKQTGLGIQDLLRKWVLQEESLIGLMQHSRNQATEEPQTRSIAVSQEVSSVPKLKEIEATNPDSPDYRKVLIKIVKRLKKEGMTLIKIAELFNNEKVQTVSGKGKWYSSSINNLLHQKV